MEHKELSANKTRTERPIKARTTANRSSGRFAATTYGYGHPLGTLRPPGAGQPTYGTDFPYGLAMSLPVIDVPLGSVAEIIAAAGTVGALFYTARGVRHSLTETKRDRLDREIAQARLVMVTADITGDWVTVTATNHSDAPIFAGDVVAMRCRDVQFRHSSRKIDYSDSDDFSVIGPGESRVKLVEAVHPPGSIKDGGVMRLDPGYHWVSADFTFIDAQGLRWKRAGSHTPERLTDPPEQPPTHAPPPTRIQN